MTSIEDVLDSSNGEYGLLVRAMRGFFPSIVALGLTRAWLSFQTGVCPSYGTSFVLRDGLDAVQPAALVLLSLLLVVAEAAGNKVRRPFSPVPSDARLRRVLMCVVGGCGTVAYAAGLALSASRPALGFLCAAVMIAVFLFALRVWCEDNISADFPALLVRLGLSFLVQYVAYAFVLVLPEFAQCVTVTFIPLLIAFLLRQSPQRGAVPSGCAADGTCAHVEVDRKTVGVLVAVAAACCMAHGFLFRFSDTVTGVWLIGILAVAIAGCWLALVEALRATLFRNFLAMAVFCQAGGVVIMLLFSYDSEWTSLSKSLSYAASMTLTLALGCYLASSRHVGRGAYAFGWLALYFMGFYLSNYAVRLFNPDMAVPLAAILLCLLASIAAIFLNDWSALEWHVPAAPEGPTDVAGALAVLNDGWGPRSLGLTQREQDVLGRLLDGWSFKQIAQDNEVSVNTIRAQAQSLYRKIGVHSREELQEWAQETFGGSLPR